MFYDNPYLISLSTLNMFDWIDMQRKLIYTHLFLFLFLICLLKSELREKTDMNVFN